MIDEKKIEEAAEKFAQLERIYFSEYYPMKNGFKAGINWFKENLWHDASEEPEQINKDKEFVECLVQFKSGELNVLLYDPWHHWWVCDIDNEEFLNIATRWLYIEDLMKGGK